MFILQLNKLLVTPVVVVAAAHVERATSLSLSHSLVPLAVFFLDFILFELRFYEFHFTFPYNYFFRVSWLLFCSTRGFILCCICVAATVACVGICAVRDGICGIIKNKRREV